MTLHDLQKYRDSKTEIRMMRSMLDDISDFERHRLYTESIEDYEEYGVKLERAMQCLSNDERTVMRAYYLDGENHTWEWISEFTHFSLQHVYRLRRSALDKLREVKL